jgi:hypothetical protein
MTLDGDECGRWSGANLTTLLQAVDPTRAAPANDYRLGGIWKFVPVLP